MKSLGLVLGGGGARGFFHLGIIKGLQKLGVKVDEIAGSSIGAVIGAIYASDPTFDVDELIGSFDFVKLLKLSYGKNDIINSSRIENYLHKMIKADNFGRLKIPLRINATDLSTAKEIVFDKGKVIPVLMASMAIPGVLPLVYHKNKILCDGGLVNIIPVSLIRSSKTLIVSDVMLPFKKMAKNPSRFDMVKFMLNIPQKTIADMQIKRLKNKELIYIKLDRNVELFDFRKANIQKLYQKGYSEVMKNKKKILAAAR